MMILAEGVALRDAPSHESEIIGQLEPGEPFALLDDSTGWAWGYAGAERRVGYVPADALVRGG